MCYRWVTCQQGALQSLQMLEQQCGLKRWNATNNESFFIICKLVLSFEYSLSSLVAIFQGTAVFWYNLFASGEGDYSTRHGACPVLVGNKWGEPVVNMTFMYYSLNNKRVWKCFANHIFCHLFYSLFLLSFFFSSIEQMDTWTRSRIQTSLCNVRDGMITYFLLLFPL